MKIIIATSRPFHLCHLARELSELGNDVTLIGYMPLSKMKDYDLGKSKYKSLFWRFFPLSIIALQRKFVSLQKKATYSLMPLIDNYVKNNVENCDVFIGLSGVISESFHFLNEKYNCITICDRGSSHIKTQLNLLEEKNIFPKNYIDSEIKGYRDSSYIMIPSIFAYNTYLDNKIDKNKILINNYGVNLKRFINLKKENNHKDIFLNEINALYVGGWSFRKSCDIMIEVLDLNDNMTLTHIGNKDDIEFPNNNRFRSLGHIANSKLSEHYKNYDVLLLPSREDGFGMVLLESLACGLPIITSKQTGGPDLFKNIENNDCINVLEETTSKSLDEVIKNKTYLKFKNVKSLLSDKDVEYYTWKAYGKRYHNILRKLLLEKKEI